MKTYKNKTIQTKKTELQEFCELNQFCTDKYTDHDYVNQYYGYEFNDHRNSNLKMLEIGMDQGGCIDMFKQWMPNLEMHGIDQIKHREFNYEKTTAYYQNAYSIDSLNMFEDNYFDYIIDDGDHTITSMAYCIEHWLDKLKPNGKMIIEDIQGGYGWFDNLESLASAKNVQSYTLFDFTQSKGRNDDFLIVIEK